MHTLTFLSTLAGGALALNVLEFITARAAACLTRIDRASPESLPPPPATGVVVETTLPPAPVPAEETAGYWWKRLFTLAGILGVVITPLQPKILVINSYLLAATLETLLDRPGQPLIPLVMFGWEREITDFDLIGVLISMGQMIAASAMYLAWCERPHFKIVFGLALTALLSLISYEVGASVYRGLTIDGTPWNAGLSGLIALGIATLEAAVGIFVIDRFLLPLLLAVLWSVAIPFRAIARGWARRRAVRCYNVRPREPGWPHPVVRAVVYPLAALDKSLMVPLRRLDRAVGSLLPGGNRHKGGSIHAEPYAVTPPESLHLSGNGHDPARMPDGRRRPAQAADHLDDRA